MTTVKLKPQECSAPCGAPCDSPGCNPPSFCDGCEGEGKKPEVFSLWKFMSDSLTRQAKTGERKGQAAFNHLVEVRPELANAIRGTTLDPFYCQTGLAHENAHGNETWTRFTEWLNDNWYPKQEPPAT